MTKKILINIPHYQRQELEELVSRGVVSTISDAVRQSLSIFIKQEKIKLWDSRLFTEYESGVLKRHSKTGVLFSTLFQKDLNSLVKEKEPQLRRGVWPVLQKLTQKDLTLDITPLELKDYHLLRFTFNSQSWHILARYHQQEIIICRISSTADQLWFE